MVCKFDLEGSLILIIYIYIYFLVCFVYYGKSVGYLLAYPLYYRFLVIWKIYLLLQCVVTTMQGFYDWSAYLET
jgi:hypothetical protein